MTDWDGVSFVDDVDEELAELYALQSQHKHGVVVSQHQHNFAVEIQYFDGSSAELSIVQNQSEQKTGQTGFCVWDASVCMSRFLARWGPQLGLCADSRVIELGTGSGLASLTLLTCSKLRPRLLTCTDQHKLLKHIARNLQQHGWAGSRVVHGWTTAANQLPAIQIAELTWGGEHNYIHASGSGPWDVLIASDCVYNEYLVAPFLESVQYLLSRDVQPGPVGVVCFELRSDEVTREFLHTAAKRVGLVMARVPVSALDTAFQHGGVVVYLLATAPNAQRLRQILASIPS
ncbi:hypothetical protein RI367_005678 [Sorochytrium milnesiophthora]